MESKEDVCNCISIEVLCKEANFMQKKAPKDIKLQWGWVIYWFKFEPSVISVILVTFYSVTKFSILSPLKVMYRFMLMQRWDLLDQRETI